MACFQTQLMDHTQLDSCSCTHKESKHCTTGDSSAIRLCGTYSCRMVRVRRRCKISACHELTCYGPIQAFGMLSQASVCKAQSLWASPQPCKTTAEWYLSIASCGMISFDSFLITRDRTGVSRSLPKSALWSAIMDESWYTSGISVTNIPESSGLISCLTNSNVALASSSVMTESADKPALNNILLPEWKTFFTESFAVFTVVRTSRLLPWPNLLWLARSIPLTSYWLQRLHRGRRTSMELSGLYNWRRWATVHTCLAARSNPLLPGRVYIGVSRLGVPGACDFFLYLVPKAIVDTSEVFSARAAGGCQLRQHSERDRVDPGLSQEGPLVLQKPPWTAAATKAIRLRNSPFQGSRNPWKQSWQ